MDEKNTKQIILDVALGLFSAKGYEGVGVSELTAAAEITKPTLYYHFGSKEGLFDAVCKENYERLNNVAAKNSVYHPNPENYHEDIHKTLCNVVQAYFSFARENAAFYRLTMANLYMPPSSAMFEVAQKYHFEQYEILGKMFREMANYHGNLIGKDKHLAWLLIGAINTYIAYNTESDEKEFVHRFMHGIYS
ncbi:MAG: TetR/AcrR family transcriptional regulator [Defluviitaleaceae bacterium]|nr:TetR/AcrR family transcriptional regulator [Defluviitaleaceae bacterium]